MIATRLRDEERAVSPVIAVILMVAITVVLAAVIGTYALNLGSSKPDSIQAAASVDVDTEDVRVTWDSNHNAEDIVVQVDCGRTGTLDTDTSLTEIGESVTTDCSGYDEASVVVLARVGNDQVAVALDKVVYLS